MDQPNNQDAASLVDDGSAAKDDDITKAEETNAAELGHKEQQRPDEPGGQTAPCIESSSPQGMSAEKLTGGLAYKWLTEVTLRLRALEGRNRVIEERGKVEANENVAYEVIKTEPKVRDCNWESFKNRYSRDHCTFAIETLLAGDDLDDEMEQEQLKRMPPDRKKEIEENRQKPVKRPQTDKKAEKRIERVRINSENILAFLGKVTGETSWAGKPHTFLRPFKILLHFHDQMENEFHKLQERFESDSLRPDTTQIPQPHIRTTSDNSPTRHPAASISTQPVTKTDPEEEISLHFKSPEDDTVVEPRQQLFEPTKETTSELGDKTVDGSEALEAIGIETMDRVGYEEIRCYMEFARTRLLPTYHVFDTVDYSHRTKIRYSDLWSLFRPGELVFERQDSKTDTSRSGVQPHHSATSQPEEPRLWRVIFIGSESVDWVVSNSDTLGDLRRNTLSVEDEVMIEAYYIDFDGLSYSAVSREWTIPRFDGEKEITKLELYPVRFKKDHGEILHNRQKRGERFQELLCHTHLAVEHDGWTLSQHPAGGNIVDHSKSTSAQYTEYIHSHVIIDFQEAFQMHPWWKPSFLDCMKNPFDPSTEYDEFAIIQWSDKNRSNSVNRVVEVVIDDDDIDRLEWNNIVDTDVFVIDSAERATETDGAKQKFNPEDFALLPSRLFVYSLRHRKFVNADIRNLKRPPVMPDPFRDLKISNDHKRLIGAIVQDHLDKKGIHRELQTKGIESLDQDFIPGKGKGLVILLHGAPGVGKTATAEAVAYAHHKPLFPITCGDLGIEPTAVESTLSEIFRLANLWDCVLLLDEAEIFLSHREKKDDNLQRNALVSIFLRTLEYYPGILFLTTNRVGVLDEALNSRVHVSIYFHHLSSSQTQALFDMNLNRSELIAKQRATQTNEPKLQIKADEIRAFAAENHEARQKKSSPWWNGRQIRNAFQIATSLAYADMKDGRDPSGAYLGREHFEQILKAIEDYERYRQELFNKTDSELAENREERFSRVADDNSGSRESRRFQPRADHQRAHAHPYPHLSFPSASSSARATPERQQDLGFQSQDDYTYTPTPHRREPPSTPLYHGQARPSTEQSSFRGTQDDREFEDYNYPQRRRD